jgi:GT2 family glycosyltransferase
MNSQTTAILIKTFNRPHRLLTTVASIREHCKEPFRLYIGDDGEVTPEVAQLYAGLMAEGHIIKRYESRLNVTTARNDLVRMLGDEAFVLRLDDDFNFSAETRLDAMLAIMRQRPEIGALSGLERQLGDGKKIRSGSISSKQGHMVLRNGVLHKIAVPHTDWIYQNAAGFRFAYANFTRNFLLIRRQVFDTVSWNEDIVIQGEHTAFMLDLQKAGWALAFTPDSIHLHNESPVAQTSEYRAVRHAAEGRTSQQDVFLNTYGIRAMQGADFPDAVSLPWQKRLGKALKRLTSRS